MLIDLHREKPGRLTAEVAIVGSGVAGQTVARALTARGISVLLIESGGPDYERSTADLNVGEATGQPYYPLIDSRLRMFGGTTAIWGGRNAELDEIDFMARPWVPWSGWPFDKDELRPFYDRAWSVFGIDPKPPPPPATLDRVANGGLVPKPWLIDRKAERFCLDANQDLATSSLATLVLHATVRSIAASPNGNQVDALDIRDPAGGAVSVNALHYVVAAGGIENARLLLASNDVHRQGLGNDHDLVGRFFMEHPHARGGRVVGRRLAKLRQPFRKVRRGSHDVAWAIAADPEHQRRQSMLNSALTLGFRPPADGKQSVVGGLYGRAKHSMAPDRKGRRLWQAYKRTRRAIGRAVAPIGGLLPGGTVNGELAIVIRAEQAPNPDSRITLTGDRDATGMPRARLDWRLTRQDKDSVAHLVAAVDQGLQDAGLGSAEPADWLDDDGVTWHSDPLISAHALGGYHHMGTTRMADDPRRGVTDRWGQVHGIENLYIAGSSLFPTGGWANPTLTIVALALRTADHLADRIQSERTEPAG